LLTGASGLVGTWLRATAPLDEQLVTSASRRTQDLDLRLDLQDEHATGAAITELRPSLIVHAAVSGERSMLVGAPGNLASAAAEVGAGLVHLSTDALHDGHPGRVHEQAPPSPISEYGRAKAEAEERVRAALPAAAIVRLPLVISGDPPDGGVRTLREAPGRGAPTTWFTDELRRPARADELAAAIWRIALLADDERAGVWQLAGPELISRHELARRQAAWLGLPPEPVQGEPSPEVGSRPKVLDVGDERARSKIAWDPTPIDERLPTIVRR
jgi:dTDP-4-dehydrorhamnose reductase